MMSHQTRMTMASMMGNLIESFDMAICGLLSIYLAKYLIGNDSKGMLLVFLTFFAGYLARPVGALVMGLLSDIYGRKIILAMSILIMGISTTAIGFIPPSSKIGVISLVTLLLLRIIQSFSCGAEYLNSSAYLIENAPKAKKGYIGSWASFGTMAGKLIASVMVLIVIYFNSKYPDMEWITWRVPFVLSLLGSTIGLYIRLCIPESMEYIMYYSDRPKPKASNLFAQSIQYFKSNKLQTSYVFALSCLGVTTTALIFLYAPIQANLYGVFSEHEIMMSNIISLLVLLCVFPVVGHLSDKINRQKIVMSASIGFLILFQPFLYSLSNGDFYQLVISQALISIPAGAYYATVPVMLTAMFPINLRCTVLSIIYSVAASLSAGLTPLISLLLVEKTGVSFSPSILVLVLILIVFTCLYIQKSRKSFPDTFVNVSQ